MLVLYSTVCMLHYILHQHMVREVANFTSKVDKCRLHTCNNTTSKFICICIHAQHHQTPPGHGEEQEVAVTTVAMADYIMLTMIRQAHAQAYLGRSELHHNRDFARDSTCCSLPAAFTMATEQLAGITRFSLPCRRQQQHLEGREQYRAAAQSRGHQSPPARRGT